MDTIRVHNCETVLALWLRADWAERARLWYNRKGWPFFWVLWTVSTIVGSASFLIDDVPDEYLLTAIGCVIRYMIEWQFLKPKLVALLACELQIWLFHVHAVIFCVTLCDMYRWTAYRTFFVFCAIFLGLVSAINLDAHPVHTRSFIMKVSFPIGTGGLVFFIFCVLKYGNNINIRYILISRLHFWNSSLFFSSGVVLLAFMIKNIYLTWRDPHCTVMIKSRCRLSGIDVRDEVISFKVEGSTEHLRHRQKSANSLTVPAPEPPNPFTQRTDFWN